MLDLLFGLIGACIGAGLFILGYMFCSHHQPPTPPAAPAHTYTEAEEAELQKQREQLREEQDAFKQLMNYNSNLAYDIQPDRKLRT